jgi:hypothetical protein
MKWLEGKKTYIVFGVVLLNGLLNQFGWGLELPAELNNKIEIILSFVALFLRAISYKPGFLVKAK